jgi:hypothetical protein
VNFAAQFQLEFAMRAAGVSESFVRRTLKTPADSMWYPTPGEMMKAGVLTRE